jgi:hypothetical protein
MNTQSKNYIDKMEQAIQLEERIAKNNEVWRARQHEAYMAEVAKEEAAKAERAAKVADAKRRQAANKAARAAECQRLKDIRSRGGK